MSETRFDGTVHPFKCFIVENDGSLDECMGGSYDNLSAVTIACAAAALVKKAIVVQDETGTDIAYIGLPKNSGGTA